MRSLGLLVALLFAAAVLVLIQTMPTDVLELLANPRAGATFTA